MKKIIVLVLGVLVLTCLCIFAINSNHKANAGLATSNTRTYVKASHILVDTEQEAKNIKSDIVSGKISFEDAAKQYSKCPSGRNGGDLGYFGRNQMVVPFEVAAFTLPVGEISNPVRTQFGYHLIKVTGEKF